MRFYSSVNHTRRAQIERLEERELLSVAPSSLSNSILARYSEVVEISTEFSNAKSDDPIPLPLTAASNSTIGDGSFNIEFETLTSGLVRVLGQTGIQRVSTMSYCNLPDPVYLDLWKSAIERWEEVLTSDVEDVVYPYEVDGEQITVDDLFLYFGFSDSFSANSSLGSSLNAGYYRDNGMGIAATGSLVFNAKYFTANPKEDVQKVFYNTALHEMGHSLGYNVAHMRNLGLLETATNDPYGLDDLFDGATSPSYYYYVGERGVEQYRASIPNDFVALDSSDRYLMETYTASGSYGAHLSSAIGTYYLFLNERDGMTYSISSSFDATLTPMTLGVMEDLGYTVDYDYADVFGSPAPEKVDAESRGLSVVLSWEKSVGDLSNDVSGSATYKIERLDLRDSNAEWVVVATNVAPTEDERLTYVDTELAPNGEYSYRVSATNIRSNEEVGVFRAKAGDLLEWESDAEKFTIYALVNNGSNALSWTRVVRSTSNSSWTVETLEKAPYAGETLYKVVAVGVILEETTPSKAVDVSIWSNGASYVPKGYSVDEWNALKRFLNLKDENGVKNGEKIDGDSYSPDFLENLTGLVWEEIDGVYRLTRVEWDGYDLVGDLDLLDCRELRRIDVSNNNLNSLELDSPNLTTLKADSSGLSTLNLTSLGSLESLSCSNNSLKELDLTNNLNLSYLDCSGNELSNLNLGESWKLKTLKASNNAFESIDLTNNPRLETIALGGDAFDSAYLPSGFTGKIDVTSPNGDEDQFATFDGADVTRIVDVNLSDGSSREVYFYVGNSADKPNAPDGLVFGDYRAGNVIMSWTDNATNEIGYKVFYSFDGENWVFVESVLTGEDGVESAGQKISRTATGIPLNKPVYFRVRAYAVDARGAEIESDALEGVYCNISDPALPQPTDFVLSNYQPTDETLQLNWNLDDVSLRSEVQYRRMGDAETEWSPWMVAEILDGTERVAVGVHQDVAYQFRVRAISSDGSVSNWVERDFNVPTLEAPLNLAVHSFDKEENTLAVVWDGSDDDVYYERQYRIAQDSDSLKDAIWQIVKSADGDYSKIDVAEDVAVKVYTDRAYEFRVRARNASGERSKWSESTQFVNASSDSGALIDDAFTSALFDEFDALFDDLLF